MSGNLYELLPLVYRQKDALRGEPLRALMDALQEGYNRIDGDIRGLYDDWFVETCDPRILPYIAALLDVSGMSPGRHGLPTDRRLVANTVAYRRRKGTAGALSNAISDATGWPALVVEGFRGLSVTQDLAFLRPAAGRTAALGALGPEGVGFGPYETAAHGLDTRAGAAFADRVALAAPAAGGAHAPDAVAVYVWRLTSQPVRRQELWPRGSGGFGFHPLGVDTALFNPPGRRPATDAEPRIETLPVPLSRGLLRRMIAGGHGERIVALQVDRGRGPEPVVPSDLAVGDLSAWAWPDALEAEALVDPELGRIAFRTPPHRAFASFATGAVMDLGGGAYDRPSARAAMALPRGRLVEVGRGAATLAQALEGWARREGDATILIRDSCAHAIGDRALGLGAGRRLSIVAANGEAPTLVGALHVSGAGAALALDGVRLAGALVARGELDLTLADCTAGPPGVAGLSLAEGVLRLALFRSVAGAIDLAGARLEISDSIVDGTGGAAITDVARDGRGGRFVRSTILGSVRLARLEAASDTIFTGGLATAMRGDGYARYCYLPGDNDASLLTFRCAPAEPVAGRSWNRQRLDAIGARPRFTSTRFGDAAYCQLALDCPREVRRGSSTGGEIGAFARSDSALREERVGGTLAEYLPAGLRASVVAVD